MLHLVQMWWINKIKENSYTVRHMNIRQALKPENDTRDQELNYANNIK